MLRDIEACALAAPIRAETKVLTNLLYKQVSRERELAETVDVNDEQPHDYRKSKQTISKHVAVLLNIN